MKLLLQILNKKRIMCIKQNLKKCCLNETQKKEK